MAPPALVAVSSLKVEFETTAAEPSQLYIPPPHRAPSPLIVQEVSVGEDWSLKIPPPALLAVLSLMLEEVIWTSPMSTLAMPPPASAWLLVTTTLVNVGREPATSATPPPNREAVLPSIVTF